MAEVVLDEVTRKFGNVLAVDHLSLTVHDREFLVVVGPSGCGKSTTLRMIGGLEPVSSGQIRFDGREVSRLPTEKRDIAMVFQSYALYPHMSVRANLEFPLRSTRVPRDEINARVAGVADRLSLTEFLERRPRQLSGGQRQRVALGRAIIREPGVFLLDEPLSNLDAQLRVSMRAELKRLHSQLEQTFIFVTHDQAEAMTMADRIVVLSQGVLQQVGTPDEIYDRPANVFVANFMGSPAINLIPVQLVNDAGGAAVEIAGAMRSLRLELERGAPANLAVDSPDVTLGIRSEHVRLVAPSDGDLRGTVTVVERMHPEMFLTVETGDFSLTVRTSTELRSTVGDVVGLSFDRESLHLFNSTGARLAVATEKARV